MKINEYVTGVKSLCVMTALLAMPFVAKAGVVTVYEDGFSGGAVDLRGATTDVGGGTWSNGGTASNFRADGSVVTNAAASGIWLPVSVEAGNIYTLSAEMTQPAGNGDWMTLGYALNSPDNAYYGAGPFGTIRLAGWGGGQATSIVEGTDLVATAGGDNGKQFDIVLDTTDGASANWTMQFYVGGVELGTGPYTAASGDFGDIGYVGFTTGNGTVTGAIDNFSLTVIPEPATLSLVSMFGLAVLFIRRQLCM